MEKRKLLVVSDSHGRVDLFREALKRQRDVQGVIFLGDGLSDFEDVALSELGSNKALFAVRGNCDPSRSFLGREVPKLDSVTLWGKKMVFTHGDLYGVKYSGDGIRRLAELQGADVLLYGHTHIAKEQYEGGVYYVNPGSLYGGDSGRSCAVLTFSGNGVLVSFLNFD